MRGEGRTQKQKEDRDTDTCMLHKTPTTHLGQYESGEKIGESLHSKNVK